MATSENLVFAGSAGIMPTFFKKMRASRPRSQGFSELAKYFKKERIGGKNE